MPPTSNIELPLAGFKRRRAEEDTTMTETATRPADVECGVATKVQVDWLTLDRQNPRLVDVGGPTSDVEIVVQLYRSEDLGEILQSVAANGYLDIEPLVVKLEGDQLGDQAARWNRTCSATVLPSCGPLAGR